VTDRRDNERERVEREEDERQQREKRDRRADELREAWRRRHPNEPEEERGWPKKEPPS
jgi:hypothetical protein